MRKNLLICVFALLMCLQGIAQSKDYWYEKEKVYMQTNHVFFKPGEQVFFKIYLVNGQDQTTGTMSNVVYVDVINPAGTLIQKLNYPVRDGYAEGSYDFPEQATGGIYKLKAYTTWMQNETDSTFFVKELTLQHVIAPRVMMKLDFPEKGYGPGAGVSADFSMRSLSDEPITNHTAKYTVSLGGKPVETAVFTTDRQGRCKIKFFLPKALSTNDGLLNITVQYDGYTEAISRSIPIVLGKIDLQFMPEGGTFVAGHTSHVAFIALNEFGKPVDVEGDILDKQGKKVASFKAYKFGMGKFVIEPAANERYTAKITAPANIREQYLLPAATAEGVTMAVEKHPSDLQLTFFASSDMEVKLVGQTKGMNYYAEPLRLVRGENVVTIKQEKFPAGIARFTLYDDNDQPLAERIIFLNEQRKLKVTISLDKKKYQPREKVSLTITTQDENGKPVPSNFSLSVIDDKLWSFADDKQDHILSWLLMSSELSGKIEEPQFYFKADEPKAPQALDLVMLTHGYRYFDYIPQVVTSGQLKFTPDIQNILSGMIVNDKQQPVKASVFLVNTYGGGKAATVKTRSDGMFFFSGLTPNTNYTLLSQSLKQKEKVYIKVLQNGSGYNPMYMADIRKLKVNDKFVATHTPSVQLKKSLQNNVNLKINVVDRNEELMNAGSRLDEVVVITAYGSLKRSAFTGAAVRIEAKDLENIPIGRMEQALEGMVAGVQVNQPANPGAAATVVIRGAMSANAANKPLFVVNGVPVEEYHLALINPNDIESVTVLKDATATALFGYRAASGVIMVDTKKAGKEKLSVNLTHKYLVAVQSVMAPHTVYSVARKFYVPKYYSLQTDERTDFRETIYWNPVVQTDKEGKATVEFYNSDANTTFRVVTEGIGYNGKAGRSEYTYASQNALSVDAKIPPYLTVGDKALVPLVIRNNSDVPQQLSVDVSHSEQLKIGKFTNTRLVLPDSSCQVLIPLEAIAALKTSIRFTVGNGTTKESLVLPIVAADKGFPVINTFSGDKLSTHHINISKMIPGTLTAKLKVYRDVEGQLLDGIESMLREPYGCFEQTSSTTYPNVFVLKYLRESGKSNPAIEREALQYIETGYKRLTGFETADNGFEWFGKTPPHEALTAYGLLEFTDMRDILKVNEDMIERTKKFLLSRRDGNGGFKLASGGYDRFASVPDRIANVYIVYALSQAGMGKEIAKEYAASVNKAIQSDDAYIMAMMALAASNMKDEANYNKLMQLLADNYRKKNLACETSVVNSRDASLRVETSALYALALMRERSPNLVFIAELVSSILNQKSYYGYGSTQATVLALKAVVEYSKLASAVSRNTNIQFVLNTKVVAEDGDLTANMINGENTFTTNYNKADESVPYSMEVSYNTFTPPNSDKAVLNISTSLGNNQPKVGETVRMQVLVKNTTAATQPMAIAKIGIPAGLSVQPWQLKEIMEKNHVAYYEIFDNYLVFYWMGFAANETKAVNLDLKAEIPGAYTAKASNCYLYYTPEHKHWNEGLAVEVQQ